MNSECFKLQYKSTVLANFSLQFSRKIFVIFSLLSIRRCRTREMLRVLCSTNRSLHYLSLNFLSLVPRERFLVRVPLPGKHFHGIKFNHKSDPAFCILKHRPRANPFCPRLSRTGSAIANNLVNGRNIFFRRWNTRKHGGKKVAGNTKFFFLLFFSFFFFIFRFAPMNYSEEPILLLPGTAAELNKRETWPTVVVMQMKTARFDSCWQPMLHDRWNSLFVSTMFHIFFSLARAAFHGSYKAHAFELYPSICCSFCFTMNPNTEIDSLTCQTR